MAQSKKRHRCPNGTRKNLLTGICEGKIIRLPKTMKRKIVVNLKKQSPNKKIIRLPKTMKRKIVVNLKKQSPNKKTKRKKRCPNGQRRNPETRECQIIKKEESKIEIIADNTPSINKEMKNNITLLGQYSPSINKQLMSLKSISPIEVQGCKNIDIKVHLKNGKSKCYKWNTKKAKDAMLTNLRSKKPIDCRLITAPKQLKSNCWFNSFFMIFFISDLGRKFNRWLREAMITGKLANGRTVEKKLRRSFFALNKYINASLRSEYDHTDFADLMDTNDIIRMIYLSIGKKVNKDAKITLIPRVGEAANPLTFYKALYKELGGNLMEHIHFSVSNEKTTISTITDLLNKRKNKPFAKVLYLTLTDSVSNKFHKPRTFTFNNTKGDKIYECIYTLDSAVLRDIERNHFSSYITCNGIQCGFDGESFSRMEGFNWMSKLNLNSNNSSEKWRFAKQFDTYFSFTKGYQILVYYLTSKKLI